MTDSDFALTKALVNDRRERCTEKSTAFVSDVIGGEYPLVEDVIAKYLEWFMGVVPVEISAVMDMSPASEAAYDINLDDWSAEIPGVTIISIKRGKERNEV